MSTVTFQVPDELAARLRAEEARIPELLEYALRELHADGTSGFEGASEVLETLARLPAPEEILALKASPRLTQRIEHLLEKNRESGLSQAEESELDRYEFLEHLVRMAKASASKKLALSHAGD